MDDLDDIIQTATAAARKAGQIQREKYGAPLNVDKMLKNDIKLEADRLCEAAIVSAIRDRFPDHAVVAEEGGKSDGGDHVWYIDPLDGTVNFYYGLPYFCTTLACYRNDGDGSDDISSLGEPLVGVVYAPLLDEMFLAVKGKGATLNGKPIRAREEDSLAEALLIVSIGNYPLKNEFTRTVTLPMAQKIRKMRNLGACAYDLANVAAGRCSGFFEYGVNDWDIAAGKLLVEEAGGSFTAKKTAADKWLIAASGQNIHPELTKAIF